MQEPSPQLRREIKEAGLVTPTPAWQAARDVENARRWAVSSAALVPVTWALMALAPTLSFLFPLTLPLPPISFICGLVAIDKAKRCGSTRMLWLARTAVVGSVLTMVAGVVFVVVVVLLFVGEPYSPF